MFYRKGYLSCVALILLGLILSACASPAAVEEPAATQNGAAAGYTELVDALSAAGATVEQADPVEQAFFSVPGQRILVNDAEIQVFEYAGEAARQVESDQISPDGSSIGTTMVTWIDQPNFWANGRLIVLYVGTDAAIIELLTDVLGDPHTQHSQP